MEIDYRLIEKYLKDSNKKLIRLLVVYCFKIRNNKESFEP